MVSAHHRVSLSLERFSPPVPAQAGRNALNATGLTEPGPGPGSSAAAAVAAAGPGAQLKPRCGDARYATSSGGTKRTASCTLGDGNVGQFRREGARFPAGRCN